VYDAVFRAAERARAGKGPTLIEALTYRWKGHSKSDPQSYRTRDEVKEWQRKDPIPRFAAVLEGAGMLDEDMLKAMRDEAEQKVDQALAFAEASPEPDIATIMEGVYA
jgi:pyruvate dehydrogenase E1 component alpha subunit